MNACAWCGAHTGIVHTRVPDDAAPGQQRILLCLDRAGCRSRMTKQTEQTLTGARP